MAQHHLNTCPQLVSGLSEDCSCYKEVAHYLRLAQWSFGLFLFEFLGGLFSGSMALVSDSLHVLLDGTENIVSAIVSKLARENSNQEKLRKVGGSISAALLLVAGVIIIHEGYERLVTPHRVEWYMVAVAIIGLCVNLWQINIHHKAPKEHHNQTHTWQNWHLVSDTAASIAVITGGFIMILADGWYWIDGLLSMGIGFLITLFTGAKILGIELHAHHHHDHHECGHKH